MRSSDTPSRCAKLVDPARGGKYTPPPLPHWGGVDPHLPPQDQKILGGTRLFSRKDGISIPPPLGEPKLSFGTHPPLVEHKSVLEMPPHVVESPGVTPN